MNKTKSIESIYESAKNIASTFGFKCVTEKFINKKIAKKIKQIKKITTKDKTKDMSCIIKKYIEHEFEGQPLFLFHSNIDKGSKEFFQSKSKQANMPTFSLSVLGVEGPIAEAICIIVSKKIIENVLKQKDLDININSIGTKECSRKYLRKLMNTLHKKRDILDDRCKQCVKANDYLQAHRLIHSENGAYDKICSSLPPTLDFVSDSCSKHFMDLIEYIQTSKIDYNLSYNLIEDNQNYERTLFEIKNKNGETLCSGGRTDSLSSTLFLKQVPSVCCKIHLNNKPTYTDYVPRKRRQDKPKVFFIHSTHQARCQALYLLDQLDNKKIKIAHSIHNEKVSEQLDEGNGRDFPFLMILGNKESAEETILIKNQKDKTQVLYNIHDIPKQLAKLV